jgi:hypothetical protein
VLTVIGGLRTFKAVVQDIVGVINFDILIIDIIILMVFATLCMLIYREKISRVPMAVGILLILLLIFSYVQFGGVQGASEYNLMALAVLLVLAYRGRQLIWMMCLLFGLIILANLDLRFNGWLTQNVFKAFSISKDNYLTTLVAVVLLMLYFKSTLVIESDRLMISRTKLNDQIRTIQAQHVVLEEQQQQLHEMNATLERDIERHTRHIVNQNKAIEDYIRLSTESLDAPLRNINTNFNSFSKNSYLEERLKDQVAELNLVIHNLKNELGQDGTNQ